MKMTFILFLFLTIFILPQQNNFGVGVILGNPTGISAKMWLNNVNSIDAALGYSIGKHNRMHFHSTYLWQDNNSLASNVMLKPHFGIGFMMRAKDEETTVFGVRGAVGINWYPTGVKLEVFAEVAPILKLAPATDFDLNGGVGVRFLF